MDTKMTIKIKRRSLPRWLCWLLVMLPFAFAALIDLLHVPYALKYVLDMIWCALLVMMLCFSSALPVRRVQRLYIWILLFLIYTVLVYLPQYQSGLYYLWGVRNNFRFYVAFFAFALFLTPGDVDDFFKWFDGLFWINTIVSFIQYYFYGYEQDFLGGLFGVEKGCNGVSNIYFSIVLIKSIIFYLNKRERLLSCIMKYVAAILVSALAEMKFFFVEAVLIIILAVLLTDFTWRKFWIVAGGIAAVIVGAAVLTLVFPHLAGWFSVDWFLETATSGVGYTGSGDLNRLNSIRPINELWLTNWGLRLFGMGMGNCDTSSFAVVNTPFYEANGNMHYTWISYAMMYLECGWIGLIFYFTFFVLVYFSIQRIEKRCEGLAKSYCHIARIMAIMCAIIAVYNASLRAEGAYMAYFVLAIPFVFARYGDSIQGTTAKTA